MRRMRRANHTKGFTLIEMLITTVVIGILVTISMRVLNVKEKAYVAAMKSDLRNMTTAQLAYFDEHLQYAPSPAHLDDYHKSPGVAVVFLGSPRGYTARAIHEFVSSQWCAIFFGDPSPAPLYRPRRPKG